MWEFLKNRDGCEGRDSRSACLTPQDSSTRGPGQLRRRKKTLPESRSISWYRTLHAIRVFPASFGKNFASLSMPAIISAAGYSLARKTTRGVGFRVAQGNPSGRASVPAELPPARGPAYFWRDREGGSGTHSSEGGNLPTKRIKGSQRQDVSRAPQPDCALNTDRMFISRRLQYCVFAAPTADRKSYPQARRLSCRYAGMESHRMNLKTTALEISRRLSSRFAASSRVLSYRRIFGVKAPRTSLNHACD